MRHSMLSNPRGTFVVVALLALGAGCVRVKSATPRRGDFIETRHVRTDVEEMFSLELDEDDEYAVVEVSRETCEVSAKEYAKEEAQEIAYPAYGALVAASVVGALGGTAVAFGHDTNYVLIPGLIALLAGTGGAIANAVNKTNDGTRVVVVDGRDKEEVRECTDSTHVLEKQLAWTLKAEDAATTSGTTDAKGRFSIRAAMLDNLARMPVAQAAAKLQTKEVEYAVTIGPITGQDVTLHVRDIPSSWWKTWVPSFVKSLSPVRQMRWEACSDVFESIDGRLDCAQSSFAKANLLQDYAGDDTRLLASQYGDYAWIVEVQAHAGEEIIFRVLAPADSADWLLMIVDLDSQAVVAEQFTGKGPRHDLRAVAPRKGSYAVLANAAQPSKFQANVVVTARKK